MTIQAVLLIPAEGDPHGLLREGLCGARPPIAQRCRACGSEWHPAETCGRDECLDVAVGHAIGTDLFRHEPKEALVIVWDGKPVPEGLHRMFCALRGAGHDWPPNPHGALTDNEALQWAQWVACVDTHFGEVVVVVSDKARPQRRAPPC